MNFDHVREQIAKLRDYQYGCSVQSADALADTMQALLEVAEAAARAMTPECDCDICEALAKLDE